MNKQITKNCLVCNKPFSKNEREGADWNKRKYCSQKCFHSMPRSEEVKNRIRETCKKNCPGWTVGKPRPVELRILHSKKMRAIVASGKHNFWKGGIAQETRSFKANFQNTIEYRLWRTAVFERDNFTCIWCGARNGNGKRVVLNADHIQSFSEHPELRLAIDNGRTLCRECHYKRHSNNF